jgi:hypothetical protein
MTFAALQTRLNVTALKRFGAQHLVDGVAVQGDFVKPGRKFTISGVDMTASVPMLVAADGEVPANPVGKPATCEGVTYEVMDAKPDGHGLTVLILQKGK